MTRKIVYITLTLALTASAFFVGKNFPPRENYLDMETVVDFAATETGLMLYTQDGSGYYWEREGN